MFRATLFTLIVIFGISSCKEDQIVAEKFQAKGVIKSGTICGWCSLNDTLTISTNSLRYVNYTQCDNSRPAQEKIGQITPSEFENLLSNLDFEEFKKLDLNSCNVCFDGCDDWIFIDTGSESHYIRLTRNDPKLEPIQEFIDQINGIKSQLITPN